VLEQRAGEPINEPRELESLMRRYQQSDAGAATKLVGQLSSQIYQFYLAYVRDRALAEDLLQDFWLRIHKARSTYRSGEPVLPWIYAIARRVRIDHYRRSKARQYHEIQHEQLPETAAGEKQDDNSRSLMELLKMLPASQREVVLLLKVSGLTLEEVARATGTSVGAVKQKAHRAYEKLRTLFGNKA
jgi:RNA polymerase sigma-70 factor, ECF subfamily